MIEEIVSAICERAEIENCNCDIKTEKEIDIIRAYEKIEKDKRKQCMVDCLKVADDLDLEKIILSYMFELVSDKEIYELIQDRIILSDRYTLTEQMHAYRSMKALLFTKHKANDDEMKKQIRLIYEKLLLKVMESLDGIEYVPYEKRNQDTIVILIEPMLGEKHAPTKRMVNIYAYLQNIGYKVIIISTDYKNIDTIYGKHWWNPTVMTALVDEDVDNLELNYYGMSIKAMYKFYTVDNYLSEVNSLRNAIRMINPKFVISMGESNFLADSCEEFTNVVTIPCTSNAPITASGIIARYFYDTDEKRESLMRDLDENQILIKYLIVDEYGNDESIDCTRADLDISEDDFVIVIAGNRLGREITLEVIELLDSVLEEESNCKVLCIGDKEALEERLRSSRCLERYRLLGFAKNFKNVIGIGDLFFNPPRIGGGTGAIYAIEKNIPIVTLGNCDVANIGKEFVCESLEDMKTTIHSYIHDAKFMEEKKSYCRYAARKFSNIDNIAQTKKFIRDVEDIIKKSEEELQVI